MREKALDICKKDGITYLEAKGGGPARPPRTGPCAGMVVGRAASEGELGRAT